MGQAFPPTDGEGDAIENFDGGEGVKIKSSQVSDTR